MIPVRLMCSLPDTGSTLAQMPVCVKTASRLSVGSGIGTVCSKRVLKALRLPGTAIEFLCIMAKKRPMNIESGISPKRQSTKMKHTARQRIAATIALAFVSLGAQQGNAPLRLSNPGDRPDLEIAIRAVRQGDLPTAERLLKVAIQEHPEFPFAHYWLGVTYMRQHRLADAEQALMRGIELLPKFPEAYDALGILYDERQLYSKSEPAFLHAIALNPKATNALFNLGLSYLRQRRYSDALAQFDRLLSVDPLYPQGQLQRGVALEQLKRYREGIVALRQYLALHPDDSFAQIKLGEALCGQGKFPEAIELLNKAATAPGPQASRAYSQLGFTYYDMARYQDALVALDKALKIDPANLDAMVYTGMVYLDQDGLERARPYFERVLAADPNNPEAQYFLGYMLFSEKHFDRALSLFQSVLKQEPEHLRARYQLAQTYFRLHEPDKGREALEVYKRLQELDRDRRRQEHDEPRLPRAVAPSQ